MRRKNKNENLTADELQEAKMVLYKRCQQETFPAEITDLKNKKSISRNSSLLPLNPFLDINGVLRVGGRLKNADIGFGNKHPIILSREHHITKLIIRQLHIDTLHGGPKLMLGMLQKQFWVIQAKRAVTSEYQQCVTCKRFNGKMHHQIMGDLPRERVTLERAFLHSSVDYAGPIEVKSSRLKSARIQKGYIALFVCLGTKAIHLELVSDVSTSAFLAAFNRFIARRGLCATMHSDNGSNFVGANNRLQKEEKAMLKEQNEALANAVAGRGINWKFIPPGAPWQGGIWERNVRSVKDHLKRVLKNSKLTFEEYGTVLCQIEAVLNSRPLCPLTNDPDNLNVLTPGHFLIGDALLAPPTIIMADNNSNNLHRWRHLQLLQQHFWKRWQSEYLNQLQQRQKWKTDAENVKKGDIVLIKDEDLPPRVWLMGKVLETHPGTDGKVRVATIKTEKSVLKRPIQKLCPLITPEWREEQRESQHVPDVPRVKVDKQKRAAVKTTKMTPPRRTIRNIRPPKRYENMIVMIAIGLLLMLGGGFALEKPIKTSPFENEAGVFFEDMGRASVQKTEWHMNIHFSLSRYNYEFKRLTEVVQAMKNVCIAVGDAGTDDYCSDIAILLGENMTEMKKLNTLIKANGDIRLDSPLKERKRSILPKGKEQDEKQRFRRAAPLNVVGWALHEVAGVMAAEQADHIEEQIEKINQNANHLVDLIKNQTSVIEGTLGLVKASQSEVNENYKKMEEVMEKIKNDSDLGKRKERLMGLALFTSLLITRFEKVQRTILDLLTDVQQGHISSYVFTPQRLKEQLAIINSNLPLGSTIPDDSQQDIVSLYKIIRSKARVTEHNILVNLIIPLVSTIEYQVFHIVPVPTKYENHLISIIPDSEYLLITLKRDQFYQMDNKEFRTCLQPNTGAYICMLKHPVYNTQSDKSKCERELLEQASELSKSCKFKITSDEDHWIQLNRKNSWIYVIRNKVTLNIVCENEIHTTILQGSGILELRSECEINQPGMTIAAESSKASEGTLDFLPALNLSETVATAMVNKSEGVRIWNMTLDHSQHFAKLYDQLDNIKKQTYIESIHHKTHYGMNISIVSILIITGLIIWWKRYIVTRLITKWYTPTRTNDVELQGIQHNKNDHGENSDDISADRPMLRENIRSAEVRHEAENVQSYILDKTKSYPKLRINEN